MIPDRYNPNPPSMMSLNCDNDLLREIGSALPRRALPLDGPIKGEGLYYVAYGKLFARHYTSWYPVAD